MTVQERLTPAGAARLLELRRAEFDLAVRLGHIRTEPAAPGPHAGPEGHVRPGVPGGPRRIAREEIDRLRGAPGFPEALRERVRTVGTREGAELLAIAPARFTRLARTGHLVPITYYINRYHAVVWLYLAEELTEFAGSRPDLLTGRTPPRDRLLLDLGEDRRPRTWRARRLELLLRAAADDTWARAAALASALDPDTLADTVPAPVDRARLRGLLPPVDGTRSRSAAARETAERLARADHPDEIRRLRAHLAGELTRARAEETALPHTPLPGTGTLDTTPSPVPSGPAPGPGAEQAPLRFRPGPAGIAGTSWTTGACAHPVRFTGEPRRAVHPSTAPARTAATGPAPRTSAHRTPQPRATRPRTLTSPPGADRSHRTDPPEAHTTPAPRATARRRAAARGLLDRLRPRWTRPTR
ncbi:DUF6397 family protein [Streptomyces clavuligerus]|nr:DUF6397 family protein [Streptomyces clavuligerus]AXU11273.1 hypothetical protein D1794_00165 [Streptomyces clavuligerus]MBY6301080.1 hypothetical protein [Streptomyces clavuligerus]QCS04141.1 hypothetical protein CRV15_00165 [Streptomyces clavuligerus]QPJ96471.1 hypothetical protein GE265_27685 [Streptomyces clavuligerus]QPL67454.1 hypothetical protein I3J05_00120 [Streptomyces clavuligerus]